MSSSKITIAGAEKYLNDQDSSLFASAVFPAGISKDLIIDAVIMRGGEFEVLYSDLEFMRAATTRWAARWNRTFTKWHEALQVEYNPLNNYDRTEEWTTTDTGQSSDNISRTERFDKTVTVDQDGSSTDSGSGTSTDQVSAYNSSVFENDRKNESSSSGTTTTSNDSTETEGSSRTDGETRSGTNSNTNRRTGRAYGNIGVTTSQQMLQAELDLQEWNLYEHIADIYLNEFAIPIY